jgi:hypothetical protein
MKKMILVLIGMVVFSVSAHAQQGSGMRGAKGMMPSRGAMMGTMMNCPIKDVMESMMDVMKIEQKLLSDVNGSEKRVLKEELAQKMTLLEHKIAAMKEAQMPCMSGSCNSVTGKFTSGCMQNSQNGKSNPSCMQNIQDGKFTPPCMQDTSPAAK